MRCPAATITSAASSRAHDHIVFHMSNGATITFNDPRRFGCMKLVARDKLDEEPLLRALGPEPLGNAFDAAMLAQACQGKKTSLKAALLGPAHRRRARQYLCLRGAAPRAAVAEAPRLDHRVTHRRAQRSRGAAGRGHPRGAQRRHQGRRLVAARPPPDRRRARHVPAQFPGLRPRGRALRRRRAARARSSASCRPGGRRSSVRCVRSNGRTRSHAAMASHPSRPTGRSAISPSALEAPETRPG